MTLRIHNIIRHHLVSLIMRSRRNDIFIKMIILLNIMLALHLPHIPEYLSISSGAAEDISDNCKKLEILDPLHVCVTTWLTN